jgi:steroid 5-alpha reductase family enzyme
VSLLALIVGITVALVVAMSGAWAVQRVTGNSGWIDAIWSLSTGAAAVAYALIPTAGYQPTSRAVLAAVLVGAWSLRLGLHIAARTAASTAEDPRYAQFRKDWGASFQIKLFAFLMIQAAAAAILALSVLVAARNPAPRLAWTDALGAIVLVVAIAGEGLADAQLRKFKAYGPNKGAICEVGLWSWSRHPNYFFEWFGWLAYPLLAFDAGGGWPWGWAALSAPIFMYYLLRYASGVPPTEEAMAKSRGAAFEDYKRRVSVFFPLPPKPREATP